MNRHVAICFASLLTVGASSAEAATSQVLRGAGGTVMLQMTAPRGPVTLAVRYAETLDAERSTLTIVSNGTPLRSLRVSSLEGGPRSAQLRLDTEGAGTIGITAHLLLAGERCEPPDPALSWLVIDAPVDVAVKPAGAQGQATALPPLGSVADHHRAWRGHAVGLAAPGSPTPEQHLAVMVAAQAILARGGAPQADQVEPAGHDALALGRATRLRVVLTSGRAAAADAPMAATLYDGPASAEAVIRTDGAVLRVHGRDPASLLRAARRLGDDSLARLCPRRAPCFLDRRAPHTSAAPPAHPAHRDPARHWVLSDDVGDAGWTAVGAGRHTLRVQVPRLDTWRLDHAPTLTLRAFAPRADRLDSRLSGLQVNVNGRPLGAWPLDELGAGARALRVRLPKALWDAQSWTVEIVADLKLEGEAPCTAAAAPSLHIGPGSDLIVRRTEKRLAGLSGFFARAATQRPTLRFTSAPSTADLVALARQTEALAAHTPGRRWRLANPASDLVLVVGDHPQGARRRARGPRGWWAAAPRAVPVLVDGSAPLLVWREAGAAGEAVDIVPGRTPCQAAPWWALHGSAAACVDGEWQVLDDEAPATRAVTVVEGEASAPSEVASVQQTQVALVNLVWAGLLLACVCGALVYWRPRRPRAHPVGLSIETGLEGEEA